MKDNRPLSIIVKKTITREQLKNSFNKIVKNMKEDILKQIAYNNYETYGELTLSTYAIIDYKYMGYQEEVIEVSIKQRVKTKK